MFRLTIRIASSRRNAARTSRDVLEGQSVNHRRPLASWAGATCACGARLLGMASMQVGDQMARSSSSSVRSSNSRQCCNSRQVQIEFAHANERPAPDDQRTRFVRLARDFRRQLIWTPLLSEWPSPPPPEQAHGEEEAEQRNNASQQLVYKVKYCPRCSAKLWLTKRKFGTGKHRESYQLAQLEPGRVLRAAPESKWP